MKTNRLLLLSFPVLILSSGTVSKRSSPVNSFIIGIDHIPIAVRNLDSAANFYKALGFSLKPGRYHPNGIRNQHVKFKDGTELELITASQPLDTLSAKYCQHLKEGEGPAFLGLFTKNMGEVAKQLEAGHKDHERNGNAYINFPASSLFHMLFFGSRNLSPTDKPEHFVHTNSADKLIGVWLATNNNASFVDLFKTVGIITRQGKTYFPFSTINTQFATLKEGEIILLPAKYQIVPNHPIIGATVQIKSMDMLKAALQKAGIKIPAIVKGKNGAISLFLPPDLTHGIWLEFRQI